MDEDGVLAFDYNDEQEMISEFLNAYDAADKTSKRTVRKLIENALKKRGGCLLVARAIADAVPVKRRRNWSKKLDKAFLSKFAPVETKTTEAEKGTSKESDKNNDKPKEVKKTNPDIVNESKSSADSALTLAIGCAAAYLATPCWAIDRNMPAAEIVRDFTIGLATLRATDKATIRRSMIENQTCKNRKRAIVDAVREAANKGTTKEKRFYKTLATSLKDTRPGEDRENERMASTADADAKTKNAEANTAEDTSVSEKKAAEARKAKAEVTADRRCQMATWI